MLEISKSMSYNAALGSSVATPTSMEETLAQMGSDHFVETTIVAEKIHNP